MRMRIRSSGCEKWNPNVVNVQLEILALAKMNDTFM